jgi:hypothetical protein
VISGSLRLRLIAAASLAITLALAISGVVISRLFTAHVEARVDAELISHLNQLTANFEIDAGGERRCDSHSRSGNDNSGGKSADVHELLHGFGFASPLVLRPKRLIPGQGRKRLEKTQHPQRLN